MIYSVPNTQQDATSFFCPDQATIDAGKAAGYVGIFVIGTEADANTLLSQSASYWLEKNISLFHVNKEVQDPLLPTHVVWNLTNLDTEPDNTDNVYQIFQVINGAYTRAVGLDAAKQTLAQVKQNYLTHCGLNSVNALGDTWLVLQKTGTQTL